MVAIMLIGNYKVRYLDRSQSGYILIGLLVLILVSGFALAQAGTKWSNARKREKEQELLKIGDVSEKPSAIITIKHLVL